MRRRRKLNPLEETKRKNHNCFFIGALPPCKAKEEMGYQQQNSVSSSALPSSINPSRRCIFLSGVLFVSFLSAARTAIFVNQNSDDGISLQRQVSSPMLLTTMFVGVYQKPDDSMSIIMPANSNYQPKGFPSVQNPAEDRSSRRRGKHRRRHNLPRAKGAPDFGNIKFRSIADGVDFVRRIPEDESDVYHGQRLHDLKVLDQHKHANYVSNKEPDRYLHHDELDYPKETGCYKPKWAYGVFPNCNLFHELALDRPVSAEEYLDVKTVGRGHFRVGWSIVDASTPRALLDPSESSEKLDFVLKTIRLWEKDTFTPYSVTHTQAEAITMLATADSNRTTSIYGHCSTSIMVERAEPFSHHSIVGSWEFIDKAEIAKDQVDDVKPYNDLTPQAKLRMSLAMAESLADLHGNPSGVIVNNDLSFDQFLRGKDGVIKLNDFNKGNDG